MPGYNILGNGMMSEDQYALVGMTVVITLMGVIVFW